MEWDPSNKAVFDRMEQLRALTPAYDTPLVRATVEARNYFTEGFKGAKTLVVLTDGGDSTFHSREKELRDKYGDTMDKCLRNAFKDTGVLVNVLGFELADALGVSAARG